MRMAALSRQPHERVPKAGAGERTFVRDAAPRPDHGGVSRLIVVLVVLAALLAAALVGYIVLSSTPAFTIASIDAEDTEHLSRENIAKLANVEEGTTLLTLDTELITQNLKRNPWVKSASFVREFPDKLKIVVTERKVDCLVKMDMGSVCWCLGDDNVWIEPVNLTVQDGQSTNDVALALAQQMDALLILDVPDSMSPEAGSTATDEVLQAIALFREQFSKEFREQIVRFSCSSVESIACTLKSGVEISLGSPTNIGVKESVVREIMQKHPNQVTYINVRVPSQPSYRKLGIDSVDEGTGIIAGVNTYDTGEMGSDPNVTEGTPDGTTEGIEGSSDGTASDSTTGDVDTSELILGEDGNYYTYEQYWGLE